MQIITNVAKNARNIRRLADTVAKYFLSLTVFLASSHDKAIALSEKSMVNAIIKNTCKLSSKTVLIENADISADKNNNTKNSNAASAKITVSTPNCEKAENMSKTKITIYAMRNRISESLSPKREYAAEP